MLRGPTSDEDNLIFTPAITPPLRSLSASSLASAVKKLTVAWRSRYAPSARLVRSCKRRYSYLTTHGVARSRQTGAFDLTPHRATRSAIRFRPLRAAIAFAATQDRQGVGVASPRLISPGRGGGGDSTPSAPT